MTVVDAALFRDVHLVERTSHLQLMQQRSVRALLACAAVLGLAGILLGIIAQLLSVVVIGAGVVVSAFLVGAISGRPFDRRIR